MKRNGIRDLSEGRQIASDKLRRFLEQRVNGNEKNINMKSTRRKWRTGKKETVFTTRRDPGYV